ncbi:hypothetical protein JEZ13_01915 [bacterium]|nr:hypothetical protein [bacterium]
MRAGMPTIPVKKRKMPARMQAFPVKKRKMPARMQAFPVKTMEEKRCFLRRENS